MKLKTTATATAKNETPKEIKARPATLESIGFNEGEHVARLKEPALKRIGKFLHTHGLIEDPAEWWFSDLKFRFRCAGRDYLLHAEAFDCISGAWMVRLTRGKNEQEQLAAKRREANIAALAVHSTESGIPQDELRELCLAAGLEQFSSGGIKVKKGGLSK